MLGRRIAARQSPPTCLPELRWALLDEWCNIPQDQIDNLILSIPRRLTVAGQIREKEVEERAKGRDYLFLQESRHNIRTSRTIAVKQLLRLRFSSQI
ncbi:kinesin-like protein [Trichonephila clavipes]|nr:kinesin-like protein [Trichonephila clavipes]